MWVFNLGEVWLFGGIGTKASIQFSRKATRKSMTRHAREKSSSLRMMLFTRKPGKLISGKVGILYQAAGIGE
jgi:hypothetical protein